MSLPPLAPQALKWTFGYLRINDIKKLETKAITDSEVGAKRKVEAQEKAESNTKKRKHRQAHLLKILIKKRPNQWN